MWEVNTLCKVFMKRIACYITCCSYNCNDNRSEKVPTEKDSNNSNHHKTISSILRVAHQHREESPSGADEVDTTGNEMKESDSSS